MKRWRYIANMILMIVFTVTLISTAWAVHRKFVHHLPLTSRDYSPRETPQSFIQRNSERAKWISVCVALVATMTTLALFILAWLSQVPWAFFFLSVVLFVTIKNGLWWCGSYVPGGVFHPKRLLGAAVSSCVLYITSLTLCVSGILQERYGVIMFVVGSMIYNSISVWEWQGVLLKARNGRLQAFASVVVSCGSMASLSVPSTSDALMIMAWSFVIGETIYSLKKPSMGILRKAFKWWWQNPRNRNRGHGVVENGKTKTPLSSSSRYTASLDIPRKVAPDDTI